LFPGLVLPLHIFEERWRALVRHLRDLPDGTPREFGVVAIDRGLEVLPPPHNGITTAEVVVHEVGCVASQTAIAPWTRTLSTSVRISSTAALTSKEALGKMRRGSVI
jgi:Lon protease-like protein